MEASPENQRDPIRHSSQESASLRILGDVDAPAPARQDLRDDSARHVLRVQDGLSGARESRFPRADQRRAGPHRVHDRGLDAVAVVAVAAVGEFLDQGLVQGEHGGLGGRVVCQVGHAGVACHAGQGDDVALAVGEHGGEEEAEERKVGEDVDLEDARQVGVGRVEDRVRLGYPGVVDQDGRRGGTVVAEEGRDGGRDG